MIWYLNNHRGDKLWVLQLLTKDHEFFLIDFINNRTNKLRISHRTDGTVMQWLSEDCDLLAGSGFFVWGLNVLLGPAWVFFRCFSFLSQSKHMQVRFIGDSRIARRRECKHELLLAACPGFTPPLTHWHLGKAPAPWTNRYRYIHVGVLVYYGSNRPPRQIYLLTPQCKCREVDKWHFSVTTYLMFVK